MYTEKRNEKVKFSLNNQSESTKNTHAEKGWIIFVFHHEK